MSARSGRGRLSPSLASAALILTGGIGRSFSVGGDFNDVSALEKEQSPRLPRGDHRPLHRHPPRQHSRRRSHRSLRHRAGLQVALMTDWRIGTTRVPPPMPELKNGVACPLGSLILEFMLGRAKMVELVLDCEFLDAQTSRALRCSPRSRPPTSSRHPHSGWPKGSPRIRARRSSRPSGSTTGASSPRLKRCVSRLASPCRLIRATHGKGAFREDPRAHVAASVDDGEPMTDDEQKVIAALQRLLGREVAITASTSLRDGLGLDSDGLVELTVLVHTMYRVDLGRRVVERKMIPEPSVMSQRCSDAMKAYLVRNAAALPPFQKPASRCGCATRRSGRGYGRSSTRTAARSSMTMRSIGLRSSRGRSPCRTTSSSPADFFGRSSRRSPIAGAATSARSTRRASPSAV